MPADVVLLVNPTAGRGRGRAAAQAVRAALEQAGCRVELLVGADATDATRLAQEAVAAGVGRLVVVGGDGMVHLGANAATGSDVVLGVVPTGTGNDFARTLGLPLDDPTAAARVVLAGRARTVDLARAGATSYACVLAAGFDSGVNDRANRMRWPRGRLRYNLSMLVELGVFRPLPYDIVVDDEPWHTDAMLVAVGNGPSYGGGMRVTPGARLDDGLLDLTVLGPMSRTTLLRMFPTVYSGRHVEHPAVVTLRGRSVRLDASATTAYADGEPLGRLPLHIEAVPGALRVLVP